MQVVSFPTRQPRIHYRHELRTLTYITLDDANGGIVRNLNHEGVAVQAVAPLRQQQRVRVRFELRFPRLRVDTYGQVSWATPTGQCGIRFVELPAGTRHQINEWIFSNLLVATREDSIFGASVVPISAQPETAADNDGLTLSASPNSPIRLDPIVVGRHEASTLSRHRLEDTEEEFASPPNSGTQLNWLSRPLSGRTLAWIVDSLVMLAGLLLFAFIFLSLTHELPQWPLTLCAALAATVFVVAAYRILFAVFGEASLGARLAHTASGIAGDEEADRSDRFR